MTEIYTCPTCRKPLFVGRPENEANFNVQESSIEEEHAQQTSAGLDWPNPGRHTMAAGLYPNQIPNSMEGIPWRFKFLYNAFVVFCLSLWLFGWSFISLSECIFESSSVLFFVVSGAFILILLSALVF